MFVTSSILCWAWNSVKHPETALHDDKLVQAYMLTLVLLGIVELNAYFGTLGINPALACAQISFVRSQYNYPNFIQLPTADPNQDPDKDQGLELAHYLWAYFVGPLLGAVFGASLHRIHIKCMKKGSDTFESLPTE